MINQLTINNKEYEIKFGYGFQKYALDHYSTEEVDGFSRIFGGLIDEDPDVIVMAYRSAIVGKDKPSDAEVEAALETAGVFDSDPFAEVYHQIKANGFLLMKLKQFIKSVDDNIANANSTLTVLSNEKSKSDSIKEQTLAMKLQLTVAQNQKAAMDKQLKQWDK